MADAKISALPNTTFLNNTDVFPLVQAGSTKNITFADLVAASFPYFTAASPILYNGLGQYSIQQASGSTAGYLSAADWTIFNNKQNAGNYITSLTGDVAASGPGAAAATIQPGSVTNAKMALMAANSVKANLSGSPATPSDVAAVAAPTATTVMARDGNSNVAVNSIAQGVLSIVSSVSPYVMSNTTAPNIVITGTTAQQIQLPNATTLLAPGLCYRFINTSTATVTVVNNGAVTLLTVAPNTSSFVLLLTNATPNGTWDTTQLFGSALTALTGDGTAAGPGSSSLVLATVNGNVGSFGSSTSIPTFTVNAKGLITAASGNAVIAPAGTLTGTTLASNVVTSSLTSLGVQASALNMGTNNITNAGTVNGVTVQTHASRHQPGGADAIPTATATSISSNANGAGTSTSLVRADHTHQLTAGAASNGQIPQFDGTNWQAATPGAVLGNLSVGWSSYDDFLNAITTTSNNTPQGKLAWLFSKSGASGSIAQNSALVSNNHPGVFQIQCAGAASNYAALELDYLMLGGGALTFEYMVYVETLSTVTNEYTLRFGLGDTASADFNNGVYFEYTRTVSTNWLAKTASGGVRSSTTTTTAVAAGSWVKLSATINAAASSVTFSINGTSVATITTNIPTSAVSFFIQQTRAAGSPPAFDVDYFTANQLFTSAR